MQTRIAWAALVSVGWMASVVLAEGPYEISRRYPLGIPVRQTIHLIEPSGLPGGVPGGPVAISASEPLPPEAQSLVSTFEGESTAIRQKAEQEIQTRRQTLITALQALQDSYTREAKLDEAVAIRDVIRQLKVCHLKPLPNPGNLTEFANRIGESLYFDVLGQVGGSVWGTEVYTYDSDLGTAAIHAGVLKPGQRGIVKVTMVKSPESHRGSTQNGVMTHDWGTYTASYTVERPFSDRSPPLATKPALPQPDLKPGRD